MGSSAQTEYCAFTKAVEHLGDRWSLLIVRELAMFGPQGFNALATGLPGRVSRSVLAARLRKLEEIGLLARDPSASGRSAPYCLTPAGEQLVPILKSLWGWAEHWVPEDPDMAHRDPSVILWWLRHRVDPAASPAQQVAIHVGGGERQPGRNALQDPHQELPVGLAGRRPAERHRGPRRAISCAAARKSSSYDSAAEGSPSRTSAAERHAWWISVPIPFRVLKPPSWEELVRRLVGRGTESEAERERRLETARAELAAESEFDVTIVNHEVHAAADELVALMVGSASPSSD